MTVSFMYEDKIIANADLAVVPTISSEVEVWGKQYAIKKNYHAVRIGMKATGKKKVEEKIICDLELIKNKEE